MNNTNQPKNHKGQFQPVKQPDTKPAEVDTNNLDKETVKDLIIHEMKASIMAGNNDVQKIIDTYHLIVGNDLPVNLNVAKRQILNYQSDK